MKIIASTRLTRAQKAMNDSRSYGKTSNTVFENAETKPVEEGKKTLYIVISSDKGLCGGVHSGLTKATRKLLEATPDADIAVLGEKAKSQLSRFKPEAIVLSFSNIKDIPNFADAQAVADQVAQLPTDYEAVHIVYNKFVNAQSYEPDTVDAYSLEAITQSRK